jgi:hypothetical protein
MIDLDEWLYQLEEDRKKEGEKRRRGIEQAKEFGESFRHATPDQIEIEKMKRARKQSLENLKKRLANE